VAAHAKDSTATLDEGRQTFRFDTFGDEDFWGGTLRLHEAIEGAALGGVGPGVSPRAAIGLGLKVDVDALPPDLVNRIRRNAVDLDSPATTLALMKLNAVVGITGFFNSNGTLQTMGIQCALCHSTVDNSFAPGIGHRLDGWANRDLNVGAIVASAPDLDAFEDLLNVPVDTVRKVLNSWGPGKFDAELVLDGKAFQPDGRSAATLIPPAFGLAGVNLHTWTGWGSIPYWNAFVAVLEMHGKGRFSDSRLNDATQFPIAARAGFANVQIDPDSDRVTSKLPALHAYQLSLKAPTIDPKLVDQEAAERGDKLFSGKAKCNNCHSEPLWTEPGWNAHKASEICIDDFQANRAPDRVYRTSPLGGLFSHQKGGFYHDGRFATLGDVVGHYNACMDLGLTSQETSDLIQYLLTL
jgi:cytochrome c peroxidase